jgi:hypothetical protein
LNSSSMLGYDESNGHVRATLFDTAQRRLIASIRERSGGSVRWLEPGIGNWTTLDLAGDHTLRNTALGPVILSTNGDETTVSAPLGADFQTVARVVLPPETTARTLRVSRYFFDRSERLVLGGIGQFVRGPGAWQSLPSRVELLWAATSPDVSRFCAIAAGGSGWLVDSSGAHAVQLPFPGDHCSFSPGGAFATFTGQPGRNELRVTDLEGTAVADFGSLYLQVDLDHYSYGTTGKNLVRLDWDTLEVATMPSPSDWCTSRGQDTTVWHDVQLIGSALIVEQQCACADCHSSGVYLLQFSPDASPQPIVAPREWRILQISVYPEALALIARSWQSGASEFEGGDHLLSVSSDGTVTEIGPFADVPGPLHAPVTLPIIGR